MYRAGRHNGKTSPGRNPLWNTRVTDDRGNNIFIPVREAANYITEDFFAALEVFALTENLGCLPFQGGWAEQPEWITSALSVLKVERYKIDAEEREAKHQADEDLRKYGKRQ